jgi:hypothetical protein
MGQLSLLNRVFNDRNNVSALTTKKSWTPRAPSDTNDFNQGLAGDTHWQQCTAMTPRMAHPRRASM